MKTVQLNRLGALRAAAVIGLFALLLPLHVRAQSKVQLFGGFSYVRGDVTSSQSQGIPGVPVATTTQHPNLPGWEFSAAYKLVPFLSAKVDFGEDYGKLNGGSVRLKTVTFGPQLSFPGPVSPFVHAEFGFAHQAVAGYTGTVLVSPGTDTSFATVLGGGLDVPSVPFFAIRLIQLDYLRTSLYGRTQHEPRASIGIVLRF